MRFLLAHERPLVEAMFEAAGVTLVPEIQVQPMEDGGMGSLAFAPLGRQLGAAASECEFTDKDGALVSVVLNLDGSGEPLELDVWKVTFAPLVQWPTRGQLSNISAHTDTQQQVAAARRMLRTGGLQR